MKCPVNEMSCQLNVLSMKCPVYQTSSCLIIPFNLIGMILKYFVLFIKILLIEELFRRTKMSSVTGIFAIILVTRKITRKETRCHKVVLLMSHIFNLLLLLSSSVWIGLKKGNYRISKSFTFSGLLYFLVYSLHTFIWTRIKNCLNWKQY